MKNKTILAVLAVVLLGVSFLLYQKQKTGPAALNEAAWNLGLPIRWEGSKVQILPNHFFHAGGDVAAIQKQLEKIVREAATRQHLRLKPTPESIAELDKKVEAARAQVAQAQGDPEALRVALRNRDTAYRTWAAHTIDFSTLPAAEQKAAKILVEEVLPAVEAVNLLQLDPQNLKYLYDIAATGNLDDYLHAWYAGGPWCQEIKEAECHSHPGGAVARIAGAGHWPETVTQTDVEKLEKLPNTDPRKKNLLSDFVYRAYNSTELKWHALNEHPSLNPHLQTIREALSKAASVEGLEPTLKNFFETRAAEFEKTDTPYPYFDGDVAWVNVASPLDVTLGFYESYNSPFEHTAMMEAYVGPLDPAKLELGKKFQSLVPEMDRALAAEMPGYTARDFSKGLPPLKFANLIASGDARIGYVPAAYYLPNIPPHGDESISKKVFALNNMIARYLWVMKPMGEIVVHPSQRNVTENGYAIDVIGHENAHGVGVDRSHTQALGELGSAIEEAKADMEGIASLPLAVAQGIITQEEANEAAIALLYGFLRALAYGMNDPHGTGAIIELTSLYKEGGIVEKEGTFLVNLEGGAIFNAAKNVARRMEKIQFNSQTQGEAAKKDLEDWLAASREEMPAKMKEFVAVLEKMPKDVFPWYQFKFSI